MQVSENILRDIARLVVWYPFRWLVSLLPLRIALGLFRLLAKIDRAFAAGKRHRLQDALQRSNLSWEDSEGIDSVIRRCFETHYQDRLVIFCYPRLNPHQLDEVLSIEGIEHLEAALSRKKGAIILQPHFGIVQLPLFSLAFKGYKIVQVGYLRAENLSRIGYRVAFKHRQRLEGHIPAKMLAADKYPRELHRSLAMNQVVFLSGDGTGGGRWIGEYRVKKLLGVDHPFPVGAYKLARSSGASLIFASMMPTDRKGSYIFRLAAPITVGEDIEPALESFISFFEGILSSHPWLWHFWDEYPPGVSMV